MRIESKVGVAVVADSSGKPASTIPTKASDQSSPSSVVKLSAAGAAAQAQDPEEISPQNRTRLDEIRLAIKEDKYPIDLDRLASKMVDDEFVRGSDAS
jgi:flagellar biosynthesis anti-sigma factor FlgM